ncbi:hypothetical protein FISHEDRAFT_75143 [Fistulina hepatica ATCC 64428]|uniref:Uncharacterized protein n=1 Tax=Fistulina hepatica ATCC 64428 TaxID=1128425 RepID=A0A0D7A8B4_9AGAR|nr:hypothetical protein FISHEDRAFT_75143 [Fistulina hepatica ATCC 64428]
MDESVVNILDSDDELPGFNETEVVGKGLKYPDKDVPKHIDHAKAAKLKIPVSFEAALPSSDIPVPKCLTLPLPPLSKSAAYVHVTASKWYSPEEPNVDPWKVLLSRPILPYILMT